MMTSFFFLPGKIFHGESAIFFPLGSGKKNVDIQNMMLIYYQGQHLLSSYLFWLFCNNAAYYGLGGVNSCVIDVYAIFPTNNYHETAVLHFRFLSYIVWEVSYIVF